MDDAAPVAGPDPHDEETLFPKSVGERLRGAREAQGLSLADIAARTRVPIRHLEAIETSDYSGMPTPTYAIGFAKAYARAVGVDEVAVAREVRGQTDRTERSKPEYQPYEMDDPTRLPPRGLAVGMGIAALLVLIVAAIWFGSGWFDRSNTAPPPAVVADDSQIAVPPPVAATQPQAGPGQVTLTALGRVWLRVYDASGKTLFENTLDEGDHYDVPADADHPLIAAGRPDKLQISIDGAALPALGSSARAIKDVPVDVAALRARAAATPIASATPAPPSTIASPPPSISPAPDTTAAPAASPTPEATRSAPRPRSTPKPKATSKEKAPAIDVKPTPAPVPTGIY